MINVGIGVSIFSTQFSRFNNLTILWVFVVYIILTTIVYVLVIFIKVFQKRPKKKDNFAVRMDTVGKKKKSQS